MEVDVRIEFFRENDLIVALCPELQVSSFGETLEEAERSIREALDLFIEGCESMGTLKDVLEEAGFEYQDNKWISRRPVRISQQTFQLSGEFNLYA